MPLSPSMKVIALRHDAVFMNAGSYVIIPKSSSSVLICRRSSALIVPSLMGSSYVFPVRLSVIVTVSLAKDLPPRSNEVGNVSKVVVITLRHERAGHNGRRLGAQSPRTHPRENATVTPRRVKLILT